jgi:hypothetical protein
MTRRRLMLWVYVTIAVYTLVFVVGVTLKARAADKDDPVYSGYKDLIPFLIAIPAAWLGYCFQRRASYLQALRGLWVDLIKAANQAVEYTRWESARCEQDFRNTIADLSKAIDAVRGVFQNVPKKAQPKDFTRTKTSKTSGASWVGLVSVTGGQEKKPTKPTNASCGFGERCMWRSFRNLTERFPSFP